MGHEGFGMGQGDCTNFLLIARSLAQLETNSCPSSYYERISGLSACLQFLRLSFSLISFLLYLPIRMAIAQVGRLRVRALNRPQRMSLFNLHTESSLNIRVARATLQYCSYCCKRRCSSLSGQCRNSTFPLRDMRRGEGVWC